MELRAVAPLAKSDFYFYMDQKEDANYSVQDCNHTNIKRLI